ncbi:MAG: hypothetical protein HOV77_08695 [Hamadaea sp.]|uniref:hypothetical protein n=1 Tax=Hamadaea sp. TaxID=2024425 RepID=UPI0017CA8937|nr:hypothetical protein [Hamadaea sp.]NUT19252.1 hypothetical protein [Hamadaea sp.]
MHPGDPSQPDPPPADSQPPTQPIRPQQPYPDSGPSSPAAGQPLTGPGEPHPGAGQQYAGGQAVPGTGQWAPGADQPQPGQVPPTWPPQIPQQRQPGQLGPAGPYTAYPPQQPGYSPQPPPAYPTQPGYPNQPGYPTQPGYPNQPWPGAYTPPPKKPWLSRLAVLAVVVVLVACALPVFGVTAYMLTRSKADPVAQPTASAGVSTKASPKASRSPARRPNPGDPQTVYQYWAEDRVQAALDRQTQALLTGDLTGYVKVVDPAKTSLISQLRKQYASLRNMKIGAWGNDLLTITATGGKEFATTWRVRVDGHPCFGAATCDEDDFSMVTTWRLADPDTPLMTSLETEDGANGPRPWQVSDLVAVVGDRTVVATTKAYASLLANVSKQAEAAAKVADRLAYHGQPPTKYVIFYAGPTEWKTWYDWDPPEWSGGVTIEVGEASNIVLNGKDLQGWFIDNLLRHEMTHAATLPGGSTSRAWWLIEGIAEYADMDGAAVSRYSALEETKKFVEGSWDGMVAVSAPRDSDGDAKAAAAYGVAFLAVRHLADKYGEQKMREFFDAVVHDHQTEGQASEAVFGEDWSTVQAGCVEFIRASV